LIKGVMYAIEIKPNKYTQALYPQGWSGLTLKLAYDKQVKGGMPEHCECCGKERKNYYVFEDGEGCQYAIGAECAKNNIKEII